MMDPVIYITKDVTYNTKDVSYITLHTILMFYVIY